MWEFRRWFRQAALLEGYFTRGRWIANRNPLRGGRRGGPRAESAHDCKPQSARRWLTAREFQKSSGKDPLFAGQTEEYQVCEDRARTITRPRTSDRSHTPYRARTPLRRQTSDQEATPDRGKSHAHPATPTFSADCQMQEPLPTLPGIRELLRADNTRSTQPKVILHRFRNTGFPDTASGRDRRLEGRNCAFSEHEAGVHTAPDEGVAGFFNFFWRTRPRLEGEGDSEEAPTVLA